MGWAKSKARKDFRARVHCEQALWGKYEYHGAIQLLLQAWDQLGARTPKAVQVCPAQFAVISPGALRSPYSGLLILLGGRDPLLDGFRPPTKCLPQRPQCGGPAQSALGPFPVTACQMKFCMLLVYWLIATE